jgi:hypothetical protein
LVRKAAVLAACGVIFGAAVAFAGVPSPANSSFSGTRINLVGFNVSTTTADSAAAGAKLAVTVRDLANNPIANSVVIIDFSSVTSDVRIDDTQANYQFLTANCGAKTVRALTNAAGVANLVVVGGGTAAVSPAHAPLSGRVYADGVLLASIGVGVYDCNGAAGIGAADLSRFLADFVGGTNPDRVDYNGVSGVGAADLSLWLSVFVGGNSTASSASYCP